MIDRSRRRLLWLIPVGILILFILLFTAIWTFRRPIIIESVERVNLNIPGTIIIDDGRLTWRRFFTRMSVTLENAALLDSRGGEVIAAGEVSVVLNPLSLLRRRIVVDSLVLDGADVELATNAAGNLNLYDALDIVPGERRNRDDESREERRWRKWDASISDVRFNDCSLALSDTGGRAVANLDYLDMLFHREGADGRLDLALSVSGVESDGYGPGYFRGKSYRIGLAVDIVDGIADIRTGSLGVQGALVSVDGSIGLYHPFESSLEVEASGTDTNLLLAFLPPNVELGDVAPAGNGIIGISGRLEGPLAGEPEIELDISCEDFAMRHIPSGMVMDSIEFNAVARRTRGHSVLNVRSFGAGLPDGGITGSRRLEGLNRPELEMKLDAALNLGTLASFFRFPGSETLEGRLDMAVDVFGTIGGDRSLISAEREKGVIRLTDFRYLDRDRGRGIQDLDLECRLEEGVIEVFSLRALTDSGDMDISGSFGNIWPLVLGGDGPLDFNLGFASRAFNPAFLFSDPDMARSYDYPMKNIGTAFSFSTTVDGLRRRNPLPSGVFRIDNLHLELPSDGRVLNRFSGEVDIGESLDARLEGALNDSSVEVTFDVEGYRGLLVKDHTDTVVFRTRLSAPALMGADILPRQFVEDRSWTTEGFNDLHLDLELEFASSRWFTDLDRWPDGRWWLHDLRGRTAHSEQVFRFNFDARAADGTVELVEFNGNIGRSDFRASGYLENSNALFTNEPGDLEGRIEIVSRYWNMADIQRITTALPERELEEETELRIGGKRYPNVDLGLKIRQFTMLPFRWVNVGGDADLRSTGVLILDDIGMESAAGGEIRMDGTIDLSDADGYRLDAGLAVRDVNLGTTVMPMTAGELTFTVGDVLKGTLSGDVDVSAKIRPDLSVNLNKTTMKVKARLTGGRLTNFQPFVAMADKFRNHNLRDVRLDDLSVRATLEDGAFHLPRTAVGSTLGYLEVEGTSRIGGYMSYRITVPNSVVDDIITGLVFGTSGDAGADVEDEEIINAENSGRFRTTVNVVGDREDIIFSLGKRGLQRLEERWEKRYARREKKGEVSP